MPNEVRKLVGTIKLNDEASKELNKINNSMDESKKSVVTLQNSLSALGGAVFFSQVKDIVDSMIDASASFEQNQVAFQVMLGGNVELADKLISDLETMSLKTPFSPEALNENAKLLMNFGIAVDDVLPSLQMLGDISGGNREKLNGLALAFAQSASTGRLMGQDLLQMINQGFNPLKVISEQTGKSMGVLKDEMSKGMISFDMVKDAFKTATSEGGIFFKMMGKQSKTWKGMVSTFEGFKGLVFKEIGDIITGVLKPALIDINEILMSFINWMRASEQNMAIVKTAVLALSVAVGTILVAAFWSLAAAAWAALSPVIIPILLITAGITALIVIVDDIITAFQGGESVLGDFFKSLWKDIKITAFLFWQGIKAIGQMFMELPKMVAGLGVKLIKMIFPIELISDMFGEFIDWIAGIPGRIMGFFKELGSNVIDFMGDLLPEWVIKIFASPGARDKIPGRADGGPVTAGDPFIVGERGPELLVMGDQDGMIKPSVTGGGSVVVHSLIGSMTINVSGGDDFADDFKTKVMDALNDLSRNIFPAELGINVG